VVVQDALEAVPGDGGLGGEKEGAWVAGEGMPGNTGGLSGRCVGKCRYRELLNISVYLAGCEGGPNPRRHYMH
jgi:hypothetical protein